MIIFWHYSDYYLRNNEYTTHTTRFDNHNKSVTVVTRPVEPNYKDTKYINTDVRTAKIERWVIFLQLFQSFIRNRDNFSKMKKNHK